MSIKVITNKEIVEHLRLQDIRFEGNKEAKYCFECKGTGRKFDVKLVYPFIHCKICKGRGYIL